MTYREEDLILGDRHVAKAEENVAKQRAIIDRLRAQGHPTELARELLVGFEASLRDNIAHRDRVRAELEALDPVG